jgi:hypothetical protein
VKLLALMVFALEVSVVPVVEQEEGGQQQVSGAQVVGVLLVVEAGLLEAQQAGVEGEPRVGVEEPLPEAVVEVHEEVRMEELAGEPLVEVLLVVLVVLLKGELLGGVEVGQSEVAGEEVRPGVQQELAEQ